MKIADGVAVVLMVLVATSGCASDNPASPTGTTGPGAGGPTGAGPDNGGGGSGAFTCVTGSMSALIDGQLWQACDPVLAMNDTRVGAFAISGSDLNPGTLRVCDGTTDFQRGWTHPPTSSCSHA